jgi:hypothetical protein
MSFRFALACAVLLGPLGAAAFAAQPPDPLEEDAYTAFPDVVPPKLDDRSWSLSDVVPRIATGNSQPILPTDSTRRQIRKAQLNELASFLRRTLELIRIGKVTENTVYLFARGFLSAGDCGAELEDTPAAKVPWFEERVRGLKLLERSVAARVREGSDASYALNEIRYRRLGAELDLLRVREQAGAANPPRPPAPTTSFPEQPPARFTAFPQFEPPAWSPEHPFLEPSRFPRTLGRKPFERCAGDPPWVKARKAAVNEGLTGLRLFAEAARIRGVGGDEFLTWVLFAQEVAAAGAKLEPNPTERAGWFAEWVVVMKVFEQRTQARTRAGTDPGHHEQFVRFARLSAELNLLTAWDPPARTLPRVGKPGGVDEFTTVPELRPSPWAVRARTERSIRILQSGRPDKNLVVARHNEAEDYWDRTTLAHGPTGNRVRNPFSAGRPELITATPLIELEETADGQVWWLAERALRLNQDEATTSDRVHDRIDGPQTLNVVRFHRLKAEADLLEFKAEVENARR